MGGAVAERVFECVDVLPRGMSCDTLERHGLVNLARNVVGETPAFSASKFVLRLPPSVEPKAGWHHDGRLLGDMHDIRSLNAWTALIDCGQGEAAPGMELVLESFDYYLTITEESHFDWPVSGRQVDSFSGSIPWSRLNCGVQGNSSSNGTTFLRR